MSRRKSSIPPTSEEIAQAILPQLKKAQAEILERVSRYLHSEKYAERNKWLADDVHIAAQTIDHLKTDTAHPWELAFAMYLGMHPRKLIPILVARQAQDDAMRAKDLALEKTVHDELPPKKPPVSVRTARAKPRRETA